MPPAPAASAARPRRGAGSPEPRGSDEELKKAFPGFDETLYGNLSEVPVEALPKNGRHGAKNYSLTLTNGINVQVQLPKRVFWLKTPPPPPPPGKLPLGAPRSFAWNTFGGGGRPLHGRPSSGRRGVSSLAVRGPLGVGRADRSGPPGVGGGPGGVG